MDRVVHREPELLDEALFVNPLDLICPITHDLFKDPVINSVGQVYEREAISNHLQRKPTDPITMMVLPTKSLTPVYPMKSRAMEFRERTARLCLERACSMKCGEPLRYLRRAAELTHNVKLNVPGLSKEFERFLLTHPGDQYNNIALKYFADELKKAGYTDQAANVYYRLLQYGDDKAEQAESLRQCLSCWPTTDSCDGIHPVVAKLAQFIKEQQAFTMKQVLDIVMEAKMSRKFMLDLCLHLLDTEAEWPQQRDLLVRYVQLLFREFDEPAQRHGTWLLAHEGLLRQLQESGTHLSKMVDHLAIKQEAMEGEARAKELLRVKSKTRRRLEVGAQGLLVSALVVGNSHPLWGLARALPLMYLLHTRQNS